MQPFWLVIIRNVIEKILKETSVDVLCFQYGYNNSLDTRNLDHIFNN